MCVSESQTSVRIVIQSICARVHVCVSSFVRWNNGECGMDHVQSSVCVRALWVLCPTEMYSVKLWTGKRGN